MWYNAIESKISYITKKYHKVGLRDPRSTVRMVLLRTSTMIGDYRI